MKNKVIKKDGVIILDVRDAIKEIKSKPYWVYHDFMHLEDFGMKDVIDARAIIVMNYSTQEIEVIKIR